VAKIGEGSIAAMGRLGLKELRNAINPSRDSVADSELGMYGSATQSEINVSRGNVYGKDSIDGLRAEARAKEQEQSKEQERGGPEKGGREL
jgi:hypothetical protein